MGSRPLEPGETSVERALETLRTAALVLRDLDFGALTEIDERARETWRVSLEESRVALTGVLRMRRCDELEVPPRGQLDRFDRERVERHVRGISRALLSEFERLDAVLKDQGTITTSIVLGLLYSVRSIEQFVGWLERSGAPERPPEPAPAPAPAPEPAVVASVSAPAAPAILAEKERAPEREAASAPAVGPLPRPTETIDWASLGFGPQGPDTPASPEGGSLPARGDHALEPPARADHALDDDPAGGWRPLGYVEAVEREPEVPAPPPPSRRRSLAPTVAAVPALPAPQQEPPPPPAPPPPPRPRRRDVDLGVFFEGADEYGEALRAPPLSVFHGCSRGPQLAGRDRCLDATCVMPVPGGVAFALADGPPAVIGGRVAAALATRKFCELLAAARGEPRDVKLALLLAAEGARMRLNDMLDSLIDSADDSDAIARLRGPAGVGRGAPASGTDTAALRQILEHTRKPVAAPRLVTPALAVPFVGGLLMRTPLETHELTFLALGDPVVERWRRGAVSYQFRPPDAKARLGPGGANPWQAGTVPVTGPAELAPGEIVLVGSPALRLGHDGQVLDKLSQLCPDIVQPSSPHEDHALRVLRQAGATADKLDLLEERRSRTPSETGRTRLFAGDLSLLLITIAPRARTPTIPAGGRVPDDSAFRR